MASSSQPPPLTPGRVRAPPVRYRSKSTSQPVSAANKSTVGADTVVEPYSNGGGCSNAAVTHLDVAVDNERYLSWEEMKNINEIQSAVYKAHGQTTTWMNNNFQVQRGKPGKDFISEVVRLLRLFNSKSSWEALSIKLLIVFFSLYCFKNHLKDLKLKTYNRYQVKRLQLW